MRPQSHTAALPAHVASVQQKIEYGVTNRNGGHMHRAFQIDLPLQLELALPGLRLDQEPQVVKIGGCQVAGPLVGSIGRER